MKKTIDGLKLIIPKDVYDPAEDSFLLTDNIAMSTNSKVLEVGSGSGYVSIYLAQKYPESEFFCLDINYQAAKITRINAIQNNISLEVINSDLMTSLLELPSSSGFFDIIVFNSPYLPVSDKGILEHAWSGGKDGLEIVKKFLSDLPKYLAKNGVCYLIVSSLANLSKLETITKSINLELSIIDQVKEGNETIILYKVFFRVNH